MKSFKQFFESYFNYEDPSKKIDPKILTFAKSKGYTHPAFHGSPETDLNEISQTRTADGLFFSPDEETASYYTGDDGRIYHVILKADNILDLEDEVNRYDFFKKFMSSGNKVRMIQNKYGEREEVEERDILIHISDLYFEDEKVKNIITKLFGDELLEDGIPPMNSEELYYTFDSNYESYDKIIGDPELKSIIDEEYPEYDKDIEELEQAYGSQEFYMNYQNDVINTAFANGYDMVVFIDPSPTGAPVSYVVNNPRQIKLADTITYDDNGNEIHLEDRFDSEIMDFRY